MNFEQQEFDFASGDESGYLEWQNQNRRKLDSIRNEWGVIFDERVRISLAGIKGEYEGYVVLLDFPEAIDKRRHGPLSLRLNLDGRPYGLGDIEHIDFASDQIESCLRMKS